MNCNQGPFEIFTGQDKVMNMKCLYADTSNPLDLTSCTAITVALPNADGTFANLTLTTGVAIGSTPVLGNFAVTITAAVSALLNVGALQNINVTFVIGGLTTIVQFYQALTVIEA
jgi:hypothetical protein